MYNIESDEQELLRKNRAVNEVAIEVLMGQVDTFMTAFVIKSTELEKLKKSVELDTKLYIELQNDFNEKCDEVRRLEKMLSACISHHGCFPLPDLAIPDTEPQPDRRHPLKREDPE